MQLSFLTIFLLVVGGSAIVTPTQIGVPEFTKEYNGYLYWTDGVTHSIKRSDVQGCGVTTLVCSSGCNHVVSTMFNPRYLVITPTRMYWAEHTQKYIMSANLDGSDTKALVCAADFAAHPCTSVLGDTVVFLPASLQVVDSKIYWADGSTDVIMSANLDGSTPLTLVCAENKLTCQSVIGTGNMESAGYLQIRNSKMYWIDDVYQTIMSADLTGANVKYLVCANTVAGCTTPNAAAIVSSPSNLRVTDSNIYWVDQVQRIVARANLDGSELTPLICGTSKSFQSRSCASVIGTTQLDKPDYLNLAGGYMFWIDTAHLRIMSAALQGTSPRALVCPGDVTVGGQACQSVVGTSVIAAPKYLTINSNRLFWSDSSSLRVMSSNWDGSGAVELFSTADTQPCCDDSNYNPNCICKEESLSEEKYCTDAAHICKGTGCIELCTGTNTGGCGCRSGVTDGIACGTDGFQCVANECVLTHCSQSEAEILSCAFNECQTWYDHTVEPVNKKCKCVNQPNGTPCAETGDVHSQKLRAQNLVYYRGTCQSGICNIRDHPK